MKIVLDARSSVGRKRDHNEDSFLLWDLPRESTIPSGEPMSLEQAGTGNAYLIAVADGMGGAAAGEVASGTALETLQEFVQERYGRDEEPSDLIVQLAAGIEEANRRVFRAGSDDPSLNGMGATLTAAIVLGEELVSGHVGDTRLYHLRDGDFRQLTLDHTHVQQLVEAGQISPEEAQSHQHRHYLIQAIGTQEEVDVDELTVPLEPRDRLLICSDGLHDMVEEDEIAETLASDRDPGTQCEHLVDRANENGGKDNITVIIGHLV